MKTTDQKAQAYIKTLARLTLEQFAFDALCALNKDDGEWLDTDDDFPSGADVCEVLDGALSDAKITVEEIENRPIYTKFTFTHHTHDNEFAVTAYFDRDTTLGIHSETLPERQRVAAIDTLTHLIDQGCCHEEPATEAEVFEALPAEFPPEKKAVGLFFPLPVEVRTNSGTQITIHDANGMPVLYLYANDPIAERTAAEIARILNASGK